MPHPRGEWRARVTTTYWTELTELFEYKVADALAGRVPRGGRRSLGLLREELLQAPLEPTLLRRLIEADRQYRAVQKADRAPEPVRAGFGGPSTWEAPASTETDESRAWEELQLLAWHHQAARQVREQALRWQREATLARLRVLFAVTENAERAGTSSGPAVPVPAAHDPLMDLHDPEVVQNLAGALSNLLLTDTGRQRVRTALSQVAAEPFPRHPDEDVLAARLEAAEREPLAAGARESLIRALKAEYPMPRDPRERPAIRAAARSVTEFLEPLMAAAPLPTLGVVPHGSVLYARHPATAMRGPDEGADVLVVHLRGGQAARWRGLDLLWQPIGKNWQMQVGGQVALLRPSRDAPDGPQSITLPDTQLRAFVSGDYLMLRLESQAALELGKRASLGRAVSLLLDPGGEFVFLRLARAAAQLLRGAALDLPSLQGASARKYHDATPDALMAFARKGVESLMVRLARTDPVQAAQTFHAAAEALGVHPLLGRRLHEALHVALRSPETLPEPQAGETFELPDTGGFLSVQLGDAPLTLQAGTRSVTLRMDYKSELAVVIPGHAPMILQDLLVVRVPDLNVILVRHGTWLAAAAGHDEALDVIGPDLQVRAKPSLLH
ncbi:hypothetical protein [Deinococcus sp. LM3]|uniref:hypothetical protein n=1 Tax=Deinococcus sp. LM3 TaxID=1938608 RepID=UPI0009C80D03|nr:hypothetical protein [Deinococcus sp. LM3]OOV13425.1 hypothetical protein BXU09_00495 [Deinococcus sp. LM3]